MGENPGGNRYEQAIWSRTLQAVSAGLVPGSRVITIFARDNAISPGAFVDVWGVPGDLQLATSSETWEAVSDSAQDNASGTGAAEIEIPVLNTDYEPATEIVAMDGTTPVLLTTPALFRMGNFRHCQAGSAAVAPKRNVGDITIRKSGGGLIRGVMNAGVNASQTGHYTVPAGKRALPQFILPNVAKNGDADITVVATNGDNGIFIEEFETAIYQSSVVAPVPVVGLYGAKSDVLIRARSTNNGVRATVLFILIEEDNI